MAHYNIVLLTYLEGGLGLPQLTVQIPLTRSTRVEKLFARAERGFDPVLVAINIEKSRNHDEAIASM